VKTIVKTWKAKNGKTIDLYSTGQMVGDKITISPVRTPTQIAYALTRISLKTKTNYKEITTCNQPH